MQADAGTVRDTRMLDVDPTADPYQLRTNQRAPSPSRSALSSSLDASETVRSHIYDIGWDSFAIVAGTHYLDGLFESQCHLPQVVGHMVGSTQQYSQSVPGRIFGVVFLGHGVVSLQPFVRRKIFKLRE